MTSLTPAPAKPRRWIWIALAAAVVLAGGATAFFLRGTSTAQPTTAATPVINGISRPDTTCVTTDGTDHQDYWNGNGWWAGRVDGAAEEMPALSVLALKLNGHQISSVWICAPRANG